MTKTSTSLRNNGGKLADERKARRERIATAQVEYVEHTGTLADLRVGDYVDTMGGTDSLGRRWKRYRFDCRIVKVERNEWDGIVNFAADDMRSAMPFGGHEEYPVKFRRAV